MNRSGLLLGLASLLIHASLSAQPPQSIIVGTVYNIFHDEFTSDEAFFRQVDRDVALMKASAITHVMVFPMSQWDPETRTLEWKRTDYLVKKFEDLQLKFVPLMLKEEQCGHYLPIWKFKEIAGLWDEYGLRNGNRNNRENVDFADPRVYPLVEAYFRAVIERYGKSPALSFYNIWNEPHYGSNAEHVLIRFREWLRQKYGSLPALRRAWGEAYTSWDEVSPFLNDNWDSSLPQIDWTMFRSDLNGILLGELTRSLRQYDSTHPVNANPVGTPWANFNSFGSYNIDDVPIAERNDIHGISYYPDIWERDHNLTPCPFWLHNLVFNTVRCSSGKKDYILTELYTNAQNGLALNGYLSKEFVSLLAWTALANDCKGLIYWKWLPFKRGRQSLGRGLCQVDGKLAPRGEAVRDLGMVMTEYGEILYHAHLRKPKAAILVDMAGLVKTLEQSTEPATTRFMFESNAGVFRALYEGGISVDVLRMDRHLDAEALKPYRIVYLPFQIVMRRDVAVILKDYVRQGGCVVADARTATLDELDVAYETSPGAGLDELFGAARPDWTAGKTSFNVSMSGREGQPAFSFEGRYFKDRLLPFGTVEVLGSFAGTDEPAVIRNRYGKGTAILSAVPLGATFYDRPEGRAKKVLLEFAREAGVVPDALFASRDGGFVNLKVHTLDNGYVVYLINDENRSKSGSLEVTVGERSIGSVKNILRSGKVSFVQKGGTIAIPLSVGPKQVMVFLVQF